MLCSFESFDLLFTGRGLTGAETTATLIAAAEHALYRPEAIAPSTRS